MNKTFSNLAMIVAVVLVSTSPVTHFSVVHASTSVSGIISADTTWTKANSPYSLTGNVLVGKGVTLRMEPGITVNMNNYYLMVNGTLVTKGTSVDKIKITGEVLFTPFSSGWNEQNSTGSIVQNADIEAIQIQGASQKIDSNSIHIISVQGDSQLISNNKITGVLAINGSPTVVNNTVTQIKINGSPTILRNNIGVLNIVGSPVVSDNIIDGGVNSEGFLTLKNNIVGGAIHIAKGSASIVNNSINTYTGDAIYTDSTGAALSIINNTISGQVNVNNGTFTFTNNVVVGSLRIGAIGSYTEGITDYVAISNNTISWLYKDGILIGQVQGPCLIYNNVLKGGGNSTDASIAVNSLATIERNYMTVGIYVINGQDVIIRNNTIVTGTYGNMGPYHAEAGGIYGKIGHCSTIRYNNMKAGIYLDSSADVDASYNWWGTTDVTAINQSIHDFKNDFRLGKVNFVPFLTAPEPQTFLSSIPTSSVIQLPTSSVTESPTFPTLPKLSPIPSQTIPELATGTTLLAVALMSILILVMNRKRG